MVVRLFLCMLWLLIACAIGILMIPFRWGDLSLDKDFARIFSWGVLRISGIKVQLEGREHLLAHQPCIYVGNHQSGMDMATFGSFYPAQTITIGKKELLYIPLFGLFFLGAGNVLLHRQHRKKAVAGLGAAVETIRNKKASVWIFPEGTRNTSPDPMLPFKKGAFHMALGAGVPIVPIVSAPLSPFLSWKEKRMRGGVVKIRILPPIGPQGYKEGDFDRLSADVRAVMLEAFRGLST
ncbi:MAG: lysophospholipid acyltransferase family protein [Bdellovibrionota bacterium]